LYSARHNLGAIQQISQQQMPLIGMFALFVIGCSVAVYKISKRRSKSSYTKMTHPHDDAAVPMFTPTPSEPDEHSRTADLESME
jgi:hypothetical protein